MTIFYIFGRVIDRETRHGLAGLQVKAWDKDIIYNDLVGSAVTDEEGAFRMEFDESYFQEIFLDRQPDLFFKIFRSDKLMRSTEDSILWNVESGETEITIEVPFATAKEQLPGTDKSITFPITGVLLNAVNGYPLSGIRVGAYFLDPSSQEGSEEDKGQTQQEYQIGEGTSGSDGRFSIIFRDTRLVWQRLCLLKQCEDSSFVLKVYAPTGTLYFTSKPLSASSRFPITLSVPLPAKPVSLSTWKELGARMEDARLVQLHELVRQLILVPTAQSLFSDWDMETRHSTLNELELAFFDPDGILLKYKTPPSFHALHTPGTFERYREHIQPHLKNSRVRRAFTKMEAKAASFSGLYEVDWVVDSVEFKRGKPGAGISKFEDEYAEGLIAASAASATLAKKTNLSCYRDYLRTIYIGPSNSDEYSERKQNLKDRFHQNFWTYSIKKKPANEILILILKRILIAQTGGSYGFGINAATIEPQGERSHQEYLDYLIGLTQLTSDELGLRYRLDLERPDSVLSSEVEENIATLQGFFSDSYQCAREPFPIILGERQGRAPFFLQYEEWRRQKRLFYAENFYQIRRTFETNEIIPKHHREYFIERLKQYSSATVSEKEKEFFISLVALLDRLDEGHKAFNMGEYKQAFEAYEEVRSQANALFLNYSFINFDNAEAELLALKSLHVMHWNDLQEFMKSFQFSQYDPIKNEVFVWIDNDNNRKSLIFALIHLVIYVLPTCFGDVALAMGDYRNAVFFYGQTTRFPVGMAKLSDEAGWAAITRKLYHAGDLPYTANLHKSEVDWYPLEASDDSYSTYLEYTTTELHAGLLVKQYTHRMEERFFRLRHGNAMLEWADALYRTDDASSIARARELYKAVLWLHGKTPPVCPKKWYRQKLKFKFKLHLENPACISQITRARQGLYQIKARLNYYGYSEKLVPTIRYRPLKDRANAFAAAAKSTQQDFLFYTGNLEELLEETLRENIIATNMLKKTSIQAKIAGEQIKIAKVGVNAAQNQVSQLETAIKAKSDELHSGFPLSFMDFVGEMVDAVTNIPEGVYGKVSSAVGSAGATFGCIAYVGYTGVISIVDAYNQIEDELSTLKSAHADARVLLGVKERELTIANLQQQIANADAELAIELAAKLGRFRETKFLNVDFWSNLANLMRRVMRRYLELGAEYAWLAERALSYEQDRPIRIIHLDYFPMRFQNVTGADLLQLDLAELEASYISGIKQTVPVKHTFSMASNFPLQFAQLKKAGRCTFLTQEYFFRQAYPGTYGYRMRAVTLAVIGTGVSAINPVRGLLTNHGISVVSRSNGETHLSVRTPEAFPLSEFRLADDLAVYGLPGETLMLFEGSGVETLWTLEFPPLANPYGLKDVIDILITFDARAQHSTKLYEKEIATMPKTVRRFIFVSALKYHPQVIEDLKGDASVVTIEFNMASLQLSKKETNRKVKNLVIFLAGGEPLNFAAIFSSTIPPTEVTVDFEKSIAVSNAPPLESSAPASHLNIFVDQDADQTFKLTIDKSNNPGVDFSVVKDVVLGVEYMADYKM